MSENIIVLGIETSCDETGVALYSQNNGIMAEMLRSQAEIHSNYGGVVPELASRDHVRTLLPLIRETMDQAGVQQEDITGIAYTAGPGLMGALFVGACVGRSLAFAWQKPSVEIHHMEGHLLAPLMEAEPPAFPFIALLVSGGHTQLIRANDWGQYELLGSSLDDAAGEAFDKVARMLDLGYPGGPKVAACAETFDHDPAVPEIVFPKPMVDRPGLDFSFSGLKTAVLNRIQMIKAEQGAIKPGDKANICAAFQRAVVDTLILKCKRALKQTGVKRLVLAGGVSANKMLRQSVAEQLSGEYDIYYPRPRWCTDNGAMIAFAGYQHFKRFHHHSGQPLQGSRGISKDMLAIKVLPRWPLC